MVGGSEMVRQVVVICQTSSESPWVHLSNHTQIKVAGTKELNLLAACTYFVDGDATPFVFDCVATANEHNL